MPLLTLVEGPHQRVTLLGSLQGQQTGTGEMGHIGQHHQQTLDRPILGEQGADAVGQAVTHAAICRHLGDQGARRRQQLA
ncbi:hypothetical protein D3C76_1384960 [compost metagenome]